jgi:hypothetical protein
MASFEAERRASEVISQDYIGDEDVRAERVPVNSLHGATR